jgi:hypothetical protein
MKLGFRILNSLHIKRDAAYSVCFGVLLGGIIGAQSSEVFMAVNLNINVF